MYVYAYCKNCEVYYNKIDYFYALTHNFYCNECSKKMGIAPETPRP